MHPLIRALLACALLAPPLTAEPSVVITLTSVGDRIRSQNPDLAAAHLRIRELVARLHQAGRLANPELETSFEHKPDFREGRLEIGFSQRFPVTGRLRLEREVSGAELHSSEAEVREVEQRLIASARELVVGLLANRQRRELLAQQSTLAAEFAGFLSETAAKGEGSAVDAGEAKLEAAGLALEMRQLDATGKSLLGQLKPLLGMKPGESLSVAGSLPAPVIPPERGDPSRRADFQVAKLEAAAAAHGVSLEQAKRYDDVEGGLFVAGERRKDVPEGYDNEAVIGLRFKIPLPLWNKNEAVIEEATAKKLRKEQEAIALGRNIRLEAEAAHAEMRDWAAVIHEIDTTLLPLAQKQATLAETTYRNGQGEIQSVLRSRAKRLELSAARIDALREFHLARVRHQAALGKP